MTAKKRSYYDHLCRKRANVIKGAYGRFSCLEKIIEMSDSLFKKCIIYCNTMEESAIVTSLLSKKGCRAVEYHSNIKNRSELLRMFSDSSFIKYLVSIGCLDQGVDIPCCDSAIILSSTSNTRQYIQRRGRVLRLHRDKVIANIHDILVTPYDMELIKNDRVVLDEEERNIIDKQIQRLEIFTDDAKNHLENEKQLLEIRRAIWQ